MTSDESTLGRWEKNANTWEAFMREGNSFHRILVAGSQMELITDFTGDQQVGLAVELACGTGTFITQLSTVARRVIGIDGSQTMLNYAVDRTRELTNCRLIKADLTSAQLDEALPSGSVDVCVCTMALMDIEDLENIAELVSRVLIRGGAFVATFAHPAFWGPSPRCDRGQVFTSSGGTVQPEPFVLVRRYKTPERILGRADSSLEVPQWYFARPLEEVVRPFLRTGLVIDRLMEPTFDKNEELNRAVRPDEWRTYPDIPPIMAVRMRSLSGFTDQ